jgi:hypothetical protein
VIWTSLWEAPYIVTNTPLATHVCCFSPPNGVFAAYLILILILMFHIFDDNIQSEIHCIVLDNVIIMTYLF